MDGEGLLNCHEMLTEIIKIIALIQCSVILSGAVRGRVWTSSKIVLKGKFQLPTQYVYWIYSHYSILCITLSKINPSCFTGYTVIIIIMLYTYTIHTNNAETQNSYVKVRKIENKK